MMKRLETGVRGALGRLLGLDVALLGADERWPVLFFVPDWPSGPGEEGDAGPGCDAPAP